MPTSPPSCSGARGRGRSLLPGRVDRRRRRPEGRRARARCARPTERRPSWRDRICSLAAGRTANVDGLGLDCCRRRARQGSHRRRRRTAHDQPEHLRDRRRRRRLPVHARRRAPRGHRAAPGAVPDEVGEAFAGRALVHVHRPRARARRTVRDRGESSAASRTASTGSPSTRSIARAPRARPRASPRSSPTRRAGCSAPPSSGRTPAS